MGSWKTLGIAAVAVGAMACSEQKFGLPAQQQSFSQAPSYNNQVDVVMVVDNSDSMLKYQQRLADQMPAFIERLGQMGLNYQIAVVTTDVRSGGNWGRFIGSPGVLKNSTSGLVELLRRRIMDGQSGSSVEQGLVSLQRALSSTQMNTELQGFLRPGALLAVVVLSNEDDYSPGSAASYITFLDQLKGKFPSGARAWVANYIGLLSLNEPCATDGELREIGLRYLELVSASGGVRESICGQNLAQAANNLRVRIGQLLTDFYLNQLPKVETIEVVVNGVSVRNDSKSGWTYDAKGNFIRFHGEAVPKAFDSIEIKFAPARAS